MTTNTNRVYGPNILKCVLFAAVVALVRSAAGQQYWDINGPAGGAATNNVAPGIWGIDNFWSSSASGRQATTAWTPGQLAVFAAGHDAIGTFTVTVFGNQLVSSISFQDGTITLSGGTLTLTNGRGHASFNVASGLTATIGSTIAGSDGLVKAGRGSLILSGVNAYSGVTDLRAGTLLLADDFALGASILNLDGGALSAWQTPLFLANPVWISHDSLIGGSEDLTFDGDISQQTGSRTLTITNSGQTVFSGSTLTLSENHKRGTLTLNISGGDVLIANSIQDGPGRGGDGLVKNGPGRLILTGANTFAGTLQVNAGTLVLGNDSAAGKGTLSLADGVTVEATGGTRTLANNLVLGGNVTFGGSDSLVFDDSFNLGGNRTLTVNNTTTFSGVISGQNDVLTKEGAGKLVLTGLGANTFSGGLVVNDGTLTAAKSDALGTGPVTVNGGTLDIGAFDQSIGTLTIASGILLGTSGILDGSSLQAQSGTVDAVLGGNGTLTKYTLGTLTLEAPSIYSGGTIINGGTLLVNNVTGSGTGTGPVTVNASGTLGGSGTILGLITLNGGGTLSPGASLGKLSTVSEIWNSGCSMVMDINSTTAGLGIGWDWLNIAGTLSLDATGANPISIYLRSLTPDNRTGPIYNFNDTLSYSWPIVTTTGGIQFSPGQDIATTFHLSLSDFSNDLGSGTFSLSLADNNHTLLVTFTPAAVPEPCSAYLIGSAFFILFASNRLFRRR